MMDRYHSADFHYERSERLTALAEHRHAATAACHRLAASAKTPEDRARHAETARRSADEAAALERRLAGEGARPGHAWPPGLLQRVERERAATVHHTLAGLPAQ